ncbi:MAG: hypothetical protein ACK5AZ_00250 [Bryobacteraceae bacterium]
MSVPPIAPPLEHLGQRAFAFYPPILGIEHNEWIFQRATWSELLVLNTKSNLEVWIPRRFLGEISRIEEPVMIVGLLKELEYKAGTVWPHERRVIQMPRAVNDVPRPYPPEPEPAAVRRPGPRSGLRLDSGPESRIGRLIGIALVLGILACFVVVTLFRSGAPRQRIQYTTADQSFLELDRQDDYYDVVRKLGPPGEDRWRPDSGELHYRILAYPQRSYSVILMGADRDSARYIGAVGKDWQVIHYVQPPHGGSTAALLRNLKPF